MDICFLKKSALFLWIGKKTNPVYASLLFGSFCLKKKSYLKKKKKKEKGTKGCVQKTEPTASATEQINLKGNPVSLLLTSMVMEITENYFKMRTRPLGHCAVILPSASPQFPNHVSSKNMSEWVCVGVSVCVWTDNSQRRILELISLRLKVRCFGVGRKKHLTIFDVRTVRELMVWLN